jgi:hypothetical protein
VEVHSEAEEAAGSVGDAEEIAVEVSQSNKTPQRVNDMTCSLIFQEASEVGAVAALAEAAVDLVPAAGAEEEGEDIKGHEKDTCCKYRYMRCADLRRYFDYSNSVFENTNTRKTFVPRSDYWDSCIFAIFFFSCIKLIVIVYSK